MNLQVLCALRDAGRFLNRWPLRLLRNGGRFVLTLLTMVALLCPCPARADIIDHGYLADDSGAFMLFDPPGSTHTEPTALNNKGQVAGMYSTSAIDTHGFIRDTSGAFTTFEPPFAPDQLFRITSLNDAGQVAGTASSQFGFILDASGATTTFKVDGHATFVSSINGVGTVAGSYDATQNTSRGYIRDASGAITTFAVPGSVANLVKGLNDAGQVAGEWVDAANQRHGFIRDASGAIATFDAPFDGIVGDPTFVRALNNLGQVAGLGFIRDPSGAISSLPNLNITALNNQGDVAGPGFLRYASGDFASINLPPSSYLTVEALNDQRQITGTIAPITVPEPISAVLLGVGLLLSPMLSRRRTTPDA